MDVATQLLANGLASGCVYALLAIGFGVVSRCVGVFHIALAGVYVAAGYTVMLAQSALELPVWVAICLALPFSAGLSFCIDFFGYEPLRRRGASAHALLICSLGIAITTASLIALAFGSDPRPVSDRVLPVLELSAIRLTATQMLQLTLGSSVSFLVVYSFRRLNTLRVMWSLRGSRELIGVLGFSRLRLRRQAMLVSGTVTGLAAALISLDVGVGPFVGMDYFVIAVVSMIIGGSDRIEGWVLGGILLGLAQAAVVLVLSVRWVEAMTFVALILTLWFRPDGLIAISRRAEES